MEALLLEQYFTRTEMLIGKDGLNKLKNSHIVIVGIGGVGSFVAEALTRSGVGKFTLVDMDKLEASNLNRQIHATTKTIGYHKVEAMKTRILEINPQARVFAISARFDVQSATTILPKYCDYIVDAIDMISAKLALIEYCKIKNVPIISSMGTGNKLDPSKLKITDIYKTKMDPLARIIRRELKKRNIANLKVICSDEKPIKTSHTKANAVPGSIAFVPSVAGLMIASEIVKDILQKE